MAAPAMGQGESKQGCGLCVVTEGLTKDCGAASPLRGREQRQSGCRAGGERGLWRVWGKVGLRCLVSGDGWWWLLLGRVRGRMGFGF